MNAQQKQVNRMVHATKMKDRRAWKNLSGKDFNYHTPIAIIILGIIWMIAARIVNKPFIFPSLESVIEAFFKAITDLYVLRNIGITMRRVMTGVFYAFIIGLPIGMIMGYSKSMLRAFAPFINSLRQVPIMAWVPLSIIWFGLGDGPTIFMIAFTGIFTVILNTIAGVQDISKEYYHAARSMGARTIDIIKDIVLPGSLPGIITGIRLAIGMGWMSVI
ncbi:ABC transporter permease subunit [Alkaliphilus sp. MSJ-5]|uniref:ABC transporter permease subunit n=2 Tax=Alkaliphilus flagellatus TaxID=2841507 RepID=A0ABS6G0H5_9FIRM|nr:ABC transporter permease subunit [Alkaliphilus flagellatus]